MGIFYLSHHKSTVCTPDRRHCSKYIEYKVLVLLHIFYIHFQEKIKISGNAVTFCHLYLLLCLLFRTIHAHISLHNLLSVCLFLIPSTILM